MKSKNGLDGKIPTAAEYAQGIHYRWEADVHTAGSNFKNSNGRAWTMEERMSYIDRYMISTDLNYQMEIVGCHVCQDAIAEAIINGRDAFEVPDVVREMLKRLGIYVKPRAATVVKNMRRS